MMQSSTASSIPASLLSVPRFPRPLSPPRFAVAALLAGTARRARSGLPAAPPAADTQPAQTAADAPPPAPKPDIALTNQKPAKKTQAEGREGRRSPRTRRRRTRRPRRTTRCSGQDAKLPDKALYDKAEDAIKHGRFDVGRLDLQTLLNTYPDSQFMMRAKLAIADSWYKEGGTAALTQAEQEYKDFITFFPNAPEAAEAQMRVGDIYFRQMDKPDRDYTNTVHAEARVPPDVAAVPRFDPGAPGPAAAARGAGGAGLRAKPTSPPSTPRRRQLRRCHRPLPDGRRHLSALQPHGRRADRPGRRL